MKLPTINMAGWSILDYELALDGIRHLNEASVWLQNQPRSFDGKRNDFHPGAAFAVQVGEEWCASAIGRMIERLEVIRFADPEDNDRRVRLLLIYYAGYGPAGESVPALQAMITEQMKPLAA